MKRRQALVDKLWQRSHRLLKRSNASVKRPLLFWLAVAIALLCGRTESLHAAIFNIADGDVAGLKSAINTANSNNQDDTINLAAGGTYTLTTVDNTDGGANGIPRIGEDLAGQTTHSLTINGNGATIMRSGNAPDFRIFAIYQPNGGSVALNNMTISNGRAFANGGSSGGAIFAWLSLTLQNCTLSGNNAANDGGAIYNPVGTVTMTNCTISNNTAAQGGGMSNRNSATVNMIGCTVNNNIATAGQGGGGIFANGTLTISNCTLTGNEATTQNGGAINAQSATVSVTACTISNNSAHFAGSGILLAGGSSLTVGNAILSGLSVANPATVTSQGYNLSSDNGGGFLTGPGDQINTNPQLDPAGLQNNGGPTQTIALTNGSPAIDRGNRFGLTTDQRGLPRPRDFVSIPNASGGDGSDVGAFEFDAVQSGATLVVNTMPDHDDGVCSLADCTLREAINTANALAGDNTITFLPAVTGTIQLGSALPQLTTNINLQGPGVNVLTVRRNTGGNYRIFALDNPSTGQLAVTISGLTIENGSADFGGGIYSVFTKLTVDRCHIKGNMSTSQGGGIYHYTEDPNDTLTVINSTLSGNSGSNIAGAIANLGSGVATVSNCTFSGNSATNAGAIINNGGNPGAVLNVRNCTFFGNNATNAASIYNYALPSAGGSATTTVGSSIFQAGSGANFINNGATFTSVGYNMSNDSAGGDGSTGPGGFLNGTSDIRNTNPQLQALANNGGPTPTHALLSNSPAINTGDPNAPAQDQRYYLRNGVPDIGAFEFSGVLAPISAVSRKMHGTGGPTFDINLPLTGPVGIECRKGQGINSNDLQVIMTFPVQVTLTNASATPDPSPTPAATGGVSSFSVNGTQVTVNLTGVSNTQRLTITLSNVSDGVNTNNAFMLPIGILLGDTNGNTLVNSTDVSQVQAQSGQAISSTNFRRDVNANGLINSTDVSAVQAKSGSGLP